MEWRTRILGKHWLAQRKSIEIKLIKKAKTEGEKVKLKKVHRLNEDEKDEMMVPFSLLFLRKLWNMKIGWIDRNEIIL